ncbi:MBL fold metallo-hydrolase [Streptomyces platensis]|uniref:MBL fold metallo-hydrolase n=1 Tax=Streptomyces platensis TaxID=58346 RepID=UPI003C2B5291
MTANRRTFLGTALAAGALSALPGTAAAAAGPTGPVPSTGTHVITLGTQAGPTIRGPRNGIATALVVDGSLYLFDCGLGLTRQMNSAGVDVSGLRAVFLTHLHSDHVIEVPSLLLYNWGPPVKGFTKPFEILGPGSAHTVPHSDAAPVGSPPTPGTRQMVDRIIDAYAYDINIRVADEGRTPLTELVTATDIALPPGTPARANGTRTPDMEPFEVYRDEKIRVLATLAHHPPVFPSLAFRVETPHGAVVLSGDTTEHDNVVRLARGARLLLHECVNLDYFRAGGFDAAFIKHQEESHTPPEGVGRVAAAAGVDQLLLTHLAGVATDEQWTTPVRTRYDGPVAVADDLLRTTLG